MRAFFLLRVVDTTAFGLSFPPLSEASTGKKIERGMGAGGESIGRRRRRPSTPLSRKRSELSLVQLIAAYPLTITRPLGQPPTLQHPPNTADQYYDHTIP